MKTPLGFLDRFLARIESTPASDRFVLRAGFFALIACSIWFVIAISQDNSTLTPTRGGSISEGIIGTPRFANPALALTRADQDVTALIYSGLLKIDSEGNLVNDVAKSVDISEDGLTYTIELKKNLLFHDETPLTARDVVYTIQLIQDPDLKSPLRGNWTDVTVAEIDEYTLTVSLLEPYAPFIENFTLGIMPAHIWSELPIEQLPFSQLNTEPIGSGPFAISSAKRDSTGLINHYTLEAFRDNQSNPRIDTLKLSFYQNEEDLLTALADEEIDATAYVSTENIDDALLENYQLIEEPLARNFGIFFNQNKSAVLRDAAARKALTAALDRDALIEKALNGHGIPITGPVHFAAAELESKNSTTSSTTQIQSAAQILEENGWSKNDLGYYEKDIDEELVQLSITLRTSNSPLFQSLVEEVARQWKEAGVEVVTEQFEQAGLVQSVIRTRDFQALLFGLDMSRSYDLYPFWHSSQQDDPGLNIAQYANVQVDEFLEAARTEQDRDKRNQALANASTIIQAEQPAIFLFQPNLTYIVHSDITVAPIKNPGRSAERFTNISQWHTKSDSLWPIFRKDLPE